MTEDGRFAVFFLFKIYTEGGTCMLTVAYIGFGNSVRRYHLPFIRNKKNVNVKWVYRLESEINPELEAVYEGIRFTSDLNDILNDEEVNLVVINTPNKFHVPYSKQFLKAGKNILTEKPFAMTVKEGKSVFNLAKKLGLVAYVNQNRRYDTDFLALKEVIESGVLGDLIEVESHYDYFNPNNAGNGDILYGLDVHTLDQMIGLFGKPDRIWTDVRGINNPKGGRDYVDLKLFYGEKLRVSVRSSLYVKTPYPRFVAHGTRGSFVKMSMGNLSRMMVGQEPLTPPFVLEKEDNWATVQYADAYGNTVTYKHPSKVTDYGKVYDDIDACIHEGAPKKIKDEEVLEVLRIMEEARKQPDSKIGDGVDYWKF